MADGIVQVAPDGSGKKIDTSELVVGANTVERQRTVIADDATAAAIAKVQNAEPADSDYGLTVRLARPAAWTFAGFVNAVGNTTAKAAAGASLRNYVTGMQISSTAGTTAGNITIQDGAGGTTLWKGNIPAGASNNNITFPTPLRTSANTVLNVNSDATLGGGAFVNLQGYVGP